MIMGKTKRSNRVNGGKTRKYKGGVGSKNPLLGKSMTIKFFFTNDGLFLDLPVISKKPEKKPATAEKILENAKSGINNVIKELTDKNPNISKDFAEFYVRSDIKRAVIKNNKTKLNEEVDRVFKIFNNARDQDQKYEKYAKAITKMNTSINHYDNVYVSEFKIKTIIKNLEKIKGKTFGSNIQMGGYDIDMFDNPSVQNFIGMLFTDTSDMKDVAHIFNKKENNALKQAKTVVQV